MNSDEILYGICLNRGNNAKNEKYTTKCPIEGKERQRCYEYIFWFLAGEYACAFDE